jgi:hypothetical protein
MMVNTVKEIKQTITNLLVTVLSTKRENLIVTIKKIQKHPTEGFLF